MRDDTATEQMRRALGVPRSGSRVTVPLPGGRLPVPRRLRNLVSNLVQLRPVLEGSRARAVAGAARPAGRSRRLSPPEPDPERPVLFDDEVDVTADVRARIVVRCAARPIPQTPQRCCPAHTSSSVQTAFMDASATLRPRRAKRWSTSGSRDHTASTSALRRRMVGYRRAGHDGLLAARLRNTSRRKLEADGPGRGGQGLLEQVFDERIHRNDWGRYQLRVNLQKKTDVASYAGFIIDEGNPTSGPYQGTSFVWFPGEGGSVAALVIGTDGFGADTAILGRPGHGRRLRALSRLHAGRVWVKPDLLDNATEVPDSVAASWPSIDAAMRAYSRVVYAAVPVRQTDSRAPQVVADLLDLFFYEHRSRHKGAAQAGWQARLQALHTCIFPSTDATTVGSLLHERRFVILEGPPGTGKTRLALEVGRAVGSHQMVQFHPARTYEDFVVGVYPRVAGGGLAFEVRPGDLLRANVSANGGPYVLIIDEINRADLRAGAGRSRQPVRAR